MFQFDWQSIVVVLALAGSAAYLVRSAVRALRPRTRGTHDCSSCSACPSGQPGSASAPAGLVTLAPTLGSSGSNDPRPGERGT